jgi:hypothetical protein
MTRSTFEEITTDKPHKPLLESQKRGSGRNQQGRLTVRHRGGGAKQHYRRIDFRRDKLDVPAKLATIEYDPNRSARIGLLHYADGEKRYILAPVGLKVGATVVAGKGSDIKPGNAMPLSSIPLGTTVHNVEMRPGRGGQLGRGAGSAIQLMAKEGTMALRLCSSLSLKGEGAQGHAYNNAGDKQKDIWGKHADWVCYYGPDPKGNAVAVIIYSHPSNLRSPATWHARDYGLFAANPFCEHDMDKTQPSGTGDFKLAAGQSDGSGSASSLAVATVCSTTPATPTPSGYWCRWAPASVPRTRRWLSSPPPARRSA